MFLHSICVYGTQNGDGAYIELIYRVRRSVTDTGHRVCESHFSELKEGFVKSPPPPKKNQESPGNSGRPNGDMT